VTIIGHNSFALGSMLGSRPPVGVAIGAALVAAAGGAAATPAVTSVGAATMGAARPAGALELFGPAVEGSHALEARVPAPAGGANDPAVAVLGVDSEERASCSSAQAKQIDSTRPGVK
jgi:hypothetical protein